MPDEPEPGVGDVEGVAAPARMLGPLGEHVLTAMTAEMATRVPSRNVAMTTVPAGEPITATSELLGPGAASVRYHLGGTPIATRAFRVNERTREVSLRDFAPEKYEERYNGVTNLIAIHEQFMDGLVGASCLVRVAVSGAHAERWTSHFDWAQGMAPLNAGNLRRAVESLYDIVKDQDVWDARDLPERVLRIGDPGDPGDGDEDRRGRRWRDLILQTTPASLCTGLNEINPTLGRLVFTRAEAWFGQRRVA